MDADNNFVENLIENVEKQRCLYDKGNGFYYNRNVRDSAWQEISEICNKSAADCKHRWKLLRERFLKELKRMEAPTGSGLNYLPEWKYLQSLMFLKDSLGPSRTRDNTEEQDLKRVLEHGSLSGDCLEDETTSPTPAKKKIKTSLDGLYQKFGETIENIERSCLSAEQQSLDDVFLNMTSTLMKELPEIVKEEFQAHMLQELYRLRRENKKF